MPSEKLNSAKDFEKKLKRLEAIVASLEKEDKPLDETVTLFKEGMTLAKDCRKTLSDVEVYVSKVVGADEFGVETEKFKVDDD